MKNKFMLAVAVLVSATLITSCSIEKRHYMNGYHVEWKNKNSNKSSTVAVKESAQTVVAEQTVPVTEQTVAVAEELNISVVAPVVENTVQETVAPAQNNVSNVAAEKTNAVVSSEVVKQEVNTQDVVTKQDVKAAVKQAAKSSAPEDGPSKGLLIVLCFLLPWLAVGLATNWKAKPLIINLLLSVTCIGAIIHAIVIVNRNVK